MIGPCKRTPYGVVWTKGMNHVRYEKNMVLIVWNECNIYPEILFLICLYQEHSYAEYIFLKYTRYIANILYIDLVNLVYIETYLIGL